MLLNIQSGTRVFLEKICLWLAYLGGIAMCCSILIIVTSISLGIVSSPILGDSELVELMIGITIFTFLPYCHLHNGNIVVDFFARLFPPRANDALDAVMNAGFALVAGFITVQTMSGGLSSYSRDWHSMFLQIPKWPVYMMGSIALVLWLFVIIFTVFEAILRACGILTPETHELAEFG
ncbi:MAG: TRAP transporter small permease [Cohaesibacter sp.]|nr:TRAP transporter small permease [Cohaesibacter sp.]